jgi:hypothetical protein
VYGIDVAAGISSVKITDSHGGIVVVITRSELTGFGEIMPGIATSKEQGCSIIINNHGLPH